MTDSLPEDTVSAEQKVDHTLGFGANALAGEGDVRVVRSVRFRHECEECGEPATKRHTYLLPNARINPESRAYRRDDISRCEDTEPSFTCDSCRIPEREGFRWCGTYTLTRGVNDHMFLYWKTL